MKGVKYGVEEETFNDTPLENIFRRAGVNDASTVVVVAQNRIDDAGVVFWALKWLGHKDVKLLPVNYLEVLPEDMLTDEVTRWDKVDRGGDFEAKPDWSWYATRDDVAKATHSPSVGLWDVRPESYYEGEKTKTLIGGTVATAENWNFKNIWRYDNMSEVDWEKTCNKMSEMFPKPNREVISFCNSGHAASTGYFAWQCGYDWSMSDASWNILYNDGTLPVDNINQSHW